MWQNEIFLCASLMKSKRVDCNVLGGWASKKKPFTAETPRSRSRQDEVSWSSLRSRRLCGLNGIAMSPVADLLLVAIFDVKKCALDFGHVESVMKMTFHLVQKNVSVSRRNAANTFQNPPIIFPLGKSAFSWQESHLLRQRDEVETDRLWGVAIWGKPVRFC